MHIIHLVSNGTWGGGEQYVLDLSRALASEGHRIEIISRPVSEVVDKFTANGLPPVARMPLRGAIDFLSAVRIASRLRRCEEVIVHVHNFKDAIVAARARALSGNDKVRVVLTRHLVKVGRTSAIYRELYSKLDAIIFVSALARDEFLKSAPPVAPDKLHVVHNSIVVPPCAPVPSDIPHIDAPVIMHHGRISPEKGLDVLLDALASLTDLPWHLRIAGEGKAQHVGPLKQQAVRLGIADRVEWLGFRDDIHAIIPSATIGVVPSTWREPFGLAVLDYMAHGVPVVTTDNGAQPEYLTSGTDSLLVPPSDPESLASALRTLLTDETARRRIATAGATTFDRTLSYQAFLGRILSVYQSIR
ncbi:glycosyltransferase family 4 protein [uncultured Muribaculum sp.]|uniref:glycosyltransferase family 4 protein n=1 Tax=uncultured Muribaculum sp. TaxID=1918613 RepID=UPI0025E1C8AF|nr:glycosyltransferase family 4 protein [uncultured Muribaculum sp.]